MSSTGFNMCCKFFTISLRRSEIFKRNVNLKFYEQIRRTDRINDILQELARFFYLLGLVKNPCKLASTIRIHGQSHDFYFLGIYKKVKVVT
jgi:hypothetical protein